MEPFAPDKRKLYRIWINIMDYWSLLDKKRYRIYYSIHINFDGYILNLIKGIPGIFSCCLWMIITTLPIMNVIYETVFSISLTIF